VAENRQLTPENERLMPDKYEQTDVLRELIRLKRECLVQLRDMGNRQQALIDEGNMTALMEVLAAKQRPLLRLQRIERALDPFRRQNPEERVWQSADARAQCASQARECETLLAAIISQEKCCEAALVRRRDEAAERLQGAHLAGYARHAYLPQGHATLSQLDLLSEK
jgi:hypothetical protein